MNRNTFRIIFALFVCVMSCTAIKADVVCAASNPYELPVSETIELNEIYESGPFNKNDEATTYYKLAIPKDSNYECQLSIWKKDYQKRNSYTGGLSYGASLYDIDNKRMYAGKHSFILEKGRTYYIRATIKTEVQDMGYNLQVTGEATDKSPEGAGSDSVDISLFQSGSVVDASQIMTGDLIIMGKHNKGFNEDDNRISPIKWRVLDAASTSCGDSGMFLITENNLESCPFNLITEKGSAKSYVRAGTDMLADEWKGSDAQQWCEDFYSILSKEYGNLILATSKKDDAIPDKKVLESMLENDKIFLLSAQEYSQYISNSNLSFFNEVHSFEGCGFGLRSPYDNDEYHSTIFIAFDEMLIDGNVREKKQGIDFSAVEDQWNIKMRPAMNISTMGLRFRPVGIDEKTGRKMYTIVGSTEDNTFVKGINQKESSTELNLKAIKILKPKTGKNSAIIKWTKVSKRDLKRTKKIQIQYSTDKNFKKNVKSKYASAKKTSYKLTKLKSKKKYYVRIRAYTKSGGKVHVSKWSAKKSFIVK